jgi:hypothetical protein
MKNKEKMCKMPRIVALFTGSFLPMGKKCRVGGGHIIVIPDK